MTATTETTTRRGPGRPKANAENGEAVNIGELLRCFVVEGKTATGADLAVRSTLAKAIAVAIQFDGQETDGVKKYASVKVFQMRSSNVAFDTSEDAAE